MTKACLDNSGELKCSHCKLCGEEWVHSKTKKHECDYLGDFKRIIVAETLEIKPEQLFNGIVVKSGNGASISFKKKFIGREVYIFVKD